MSAFGWPFLVGRGRRTGHRVLLAPDFLVAEQDHGILEVTSEHLTVVTSSAGRRLSVRCSTHQVSAADVGDPDNPRDEHGRPLRLIYGVVATGVEPANADLRIALSSALDTYRRFLRRENEFEVEPAPAFPLTAPARPSLVAPVTAAPPRRPGSRTVAVLSAVAVAAVLAIVLSVLLGQSKPEKVPGFPCPTSASGSTAQCGTATSSSGRPLPSAP